MNHRLSIAPMVRYSNRHGRFFFRLLGKHLRLYSEMIVDQAILRGNAHKILEHHQAEKPLALQLAGHCPSSLALVMPIVEDYGYEEININMGCPADCLSEKMGVALMREPQCVAQMIRAVREKTSLRLTVKCRLGVFPQNPEHTLMPFLRMLEEEGCEEIILHARMALLGKYNPKQNRTIPPLDYEAVYQAASALNIPITINGGIKNKEAIAKHLHHVSGVMLGRLALDDPWEVACIYAHFFQQNLPDRMAIIKEFYAYALEYSVPFSLFMSCVLSLFRGMYGVKILVRFFQQHRAQFVASFKEERALFSLLEEMLSPHFGKAS